jgi:hypothetical protein
MLTLKSCTKKTIFSTDYNDLEALISGVYGHDYEIMPMEEVGSSQSAATYNQDVAKGMLDGYELEELETLKGGKPNQYILGTILTDLANKGHLEEGEYIIDVSW